MTDFNISSFVVSRRLLPLALSLAVGLVVCAGAYAEPASEPGMIPALDLPGETDAGITPISELLQDTEPVRLQKKTEPAFLQAEEPEKPVAPAASPAATAVPKASLPASVAPADNDASKASQSETKSETATADDGFIKPAVNTLKERFSQGMDMKQNMHVLGFSMRKHERGIKPISYSPLPAIVIFPVIKHGNERAFGDLPELFAREYAQRIELKAPETKVYHPVYTVDEIRLRGFGHVYDQIMRYYIKAGRPEPTALDYLLKQLAGNGRSVARVVFVEADLDMGQPDASTGPLERFSAWTTDATPKQMKYFVRSRLQVFDAEESGFPMVWGGSWSRSIKTNRFVNVTPSVFADSDSQQAFARVSREMSRELLLLTPKEVYMAPQYDVSVQGQLVEGKAESAFPNFTEMKPSRSPVSDENQKAIQRILQRQNSISP